MSEDFISSGEDFNLSVRQTLFMLLSKSYLPSSLQLLLRISHHIPAQNFPYNSHTQYGFVAYDHLDTLPLGPLHPDDNNLSHRNFDSTEGTKTETKETRRRDTIGTYGGGWKYRIEGLRGFTLRGNFEFAVLQTQ